MAQELLSTFKDDLGEVALMPGTGGAFRIEADGVLLWERVRDGGFSGCEGPQAASARPARPGRDLGHIDR